MAVIIRVGGRRAQEWSWVKIQDGYGSAKLLQFREVEVYAAASGGATLCVGGTAYASSIYMAERAAANAFDGIADDTSVWSSASQTNPWIAYRFSSPILTVGRIRLMARTYNNDPRRKLENGTLSVSSDSTNGTDGSWITLKTGITMTAFNVWETFYV